FFVIFCSALRRPTPPFCFPYTTLFRSAPLSFRSRHRSGRAVGYGGGNFEVRDQRTTPLNHGRVADCEFAGRVWHAGCRSVIAWRSEEHTSELQSRENLVCRLLLEKKNK